MENYGFVSPYQGQVSILKQDLKEYGPAVVENVRTIDSWQGREKGVIFFSAVRSNPNNNVGFLSNLRRINVALTRAQHGLIVVGNEKTLMNDRFWSEVVQYFHDMKSFAYGLEEAKRLIDEKIIDSK